MTRIGILTGGGDCPGLNAAIRAVAKTAIREGLEVLGIRDAWRGLLDGDTLVLDWLHTSEIIDKGGTILGTSRFSPLRVESGPQQVLAQFQKLGLTALVVLGGEGTLSIAAKLSRLGLPVIGIPKTIDNDVAETDFSIGFQTAVQIASEALDRLRTTAESHHRVMLLEVMGRTAGWIATYAGLAAGADAILIPEISFDEAQMKALFDMLKARNQKGKKFSLIVVAEGIKLHADIAPVDMKASVTPDIGQVVAHIIQDRTGLETRFSSLDYIQRGGTPVAYDRNLATAFGVKATQLIQEKRFGEMTALQGNRIISVPLEKVVDRVRTLDMEAYAVAGKFFS